MKNCPGKDTFTKLIHNKLSKISGILYKVKDKLNEKAMLSLYYALFLPYIQYCVEVWGSTYTANIRCIALIQKKVVRILCNKDKRAHTNSLFYKLKIIKFNDLIQLHICLAIHKANLKQLPKNIIELLGLEQNSTYNTRNVNKYHHKLTRTNVKFNCVSVRGVILYNELPENLICSQNCYQFKKRYKTYILEKYNSICGEL